jgi:hypothetical protein
MYNRIEYRKSYLLHRLDGPAIEWVDGKVEYYIDGYHLTYDEFFDNPKRKSTNNNYTKIQYLNEHDLLDRTDGPALIKGNTFGWYLNGILHREDGPAIETKSLEQWYLNGILHRADGPAIVEKSRYFNTYFWYLNGKEHRLDGPAHYRKGKGFYSDWNDYYIDDVQYTKSDYYEHQDVINYQLSLDRKNKLNKLLNDTQ